MQSIAKVVAFERSHSQTLKVKTALHVFIIDSWSERVKDLSFYILIP